MGGTELSGGFLEEPRMPPTLPPGRQRLQTSNCDIGSSRRAGSRTRAVEGRWEGGLARASERDNLGFRPSRKRSESTSQSSLLLLW